MSRRLALVASLLFGSGTCALVYQVIWFRELRLVFGNSTAANAATLAIFMGGLGAGSAVLGRYANRHPRPLLLYGNLELAIAISAALSPLLIHAARALYIGVGGYTVMGSFGATVARLLLSLLTLGTATFLMGGTMPAAAKAVETRDDLGRGKLALVYGLNTVGAVTGVCLATFVLVEQFGNRTTLFLAVLVNLLIGIFARSAGRDETALENRSTATASGETSPVAETPASGADLGAGAIDRTQVRFVLLSAAIVGFLFMMMELVWYRMLSPLLGGSTFTFGLILAWALLGIGLGGLLYAQLGVRRPATLSLFAWSCGFEAFFFGLPLALGDRIALLAQQTRPLGNLGFSWFLVAWSLVVLVVVLPAAVVSGFQFPVLVALMGRGREKVANQLGSVYAWNTLGSIIGSLAGGFVLLSALSAPGAWRLGVILAAGLALFAVAFDRRRNGSSWTRVLVTAVPALLALAFATSEGPTALWRHEAIGVGRAGLQTDRNEMRNALHRAQRNLLWQEDGKEGSVALQASDGLAFVINGKIDGNSVGDAGTQVMLGLTGALLHPNPEKALVIGLGTGSTAGWLADAPRVKEVDVVELEPKITTVARLCAPVNRGVLDNPRVDLIFADAREVLLTTPKRYELIVSEPSNPYRAGISSLFSVEFYDAVSSRLKGSGYFLQWLQAYEVDDQTVGTVIATLKTVFADVEVWQTQPRDLLLIASNQPIEHDPHLLIERVQTEPFRTALAAAWNTDSAEGVLARYVASDGLSQAVAQNRRFEVNTDNRNLVEFGFARSLGRTSLFRLAEMRQLADDLGYNRPRGAEQWSDIDWFAVERERLGAFEATSGRLTDNQQQELQILSSFRQSLKDKDYRAALSHWRALGRGPSTRAEKTAVAWLLARVGDPSSLVLAEELGADFPVEKDLIRARLALSTGKPELALTELRSAIGQLRQTPWGDKNLRDQTFAIAREIAAQPALANAVLQLLDGPPLAVYVLEEERLMTRLLLSWQGGPELYAGVLAEIEPWVPWRGDTLMRRSTVYRALKHPLAERADADLGAFLETASVPFSTGLDPSALEKRFHETPDDPATSVAATSPGQPRAR